MTDTDVIIVGAGAAGCVLASRLSEDSRRRVTLIEAGADTPPWKVPADIRDVYPVAYSNPAYFWPGLQASGLAGSAPAPYLQARIMGGGSSVMGMWALRGRPTDYDAWRDAGAHGWGWDDVLPSFNRLERDADFAGPAHGGDGPIRIQRHFRDAWPGFARAMAKAASRHGLPYREDINADFADGVFPVPVINDDGGRVSAAMGYLPAPVRARPNLAIRTGATAAHIVVDGRRAVAVEVGHADGRIEQIFGREIIVAAGAIHSPAILLRSGIGPAAELAAMGIESLIDLPVGRNLQNHCVLNLAMPLVRSARQARTLHTYGLACARVSSGAARAPQGDLLLQFIANTSPNAHGDRLGILGSALYAPFSRGAVTLASPDPAVPPRVDFNLLADPSDTARLAQAILLSLRLLADPAVCAVRGPVVAVGPSSMVRRLNRPGAASRLMSALLAAVLDGPRPVRDAALRRAGMVLAPDLDRSASPTDLMRYVNPIFHPVGTCAMGAADDPRAVVDPSCRVRGLDGLAVIDASIMPVIPSANTCIPTMMVAEHAAPMVARRL